MDVPTLTEMMDRTNLNNRHYGPKELEQLLFQPQVESGIADTVLNNIPRYLFRIASPFSDGSTNEIWVKSQSAHQNKRSSTEDIFFNLDNKKRTEIARILSLHLWWRPKSRLDDNFVSWTSSLLFAIQYIYYRRSSIRDGSSLADIRFYIVDTTKFPRGTFMRDLDLIDIFSEYDTDLKFLQSLRNGPELYFGEYLSQGSLKIENKCHAISAEIFFQQDRLSRIQPLFTEMPSITEDNPRWAKEVVRLRGAIWPEPNLPSLHSADMINRLTAIREIVRDVPAEWSFPLAIYFAGLIGSESSTIENKTATDNEIFSFFHSEPFQHLRIEHKFKPANFNVVVTNVTTELKQVRKLVREIHKHASLRKILDRVNEVQLIARDLRVGRDLVIVDDPNRMLAHLGQSIVSKLSTVQMLCKEGVLDSKATTGSPGGKEI